MYFREIGDFLPQFRHIILQMCIELISPLFRMRRRVLILSKLNRQYFKMMFARWRKSISLSMAVNLLWVDVMKIVALSPLQGDCLTESDYQQIDQWKCISSLLAGSILCFCCRLLTFFIINFSKNIFLEHYQNIKRLKTRSGLAFCRSWFGSKLFAKVISRRQKSPLARKGLHCNT